MPKRTVVKGGERMLVYSFAIGCDALQAILSFFVVTEIVNHILDFIIGGVLIAYGLKRGLLDMNKSMTLLAVFLGEQIPYVNALPFWTYDVRNLYKGIPRSEDEIVEKPNPGTTPPRMQRRPYNAEPGIRPPRLK